MPQLSPRRAASAPAIRPIDALLAMSILLPAVLFGLASWRGYHEAVRENDLRIERTIGILREHAVKVFETQRLVIEQVNIRLRFMDWSSPTDKADIHVLMKRLQDDLAQVQTVTLCDDEGRLVASGRTFPADSNISFADRDWFVALKEADSKLPFISRVYKGRQSGQPVFNAAMRSYSAVPGFGGAIAVSVNTAYFEQFYRLVEPSLESSVALVREDGQVLARDPPAGPRELPPSSELRRRMARDNEGRFTTRSDIDGSESYFGYSRVGDYPVFVTFAITWDAALAPWRRDLAGYGIVAVLAALALLGVSLFAIRQSQRERLATLRWQGAAADFSAEAEARSDIEEQLRQSQKMEAVGQLTGGIAHDFNNLLTGIVGSLDLLRQRVAQGRQEGLERYVQAATASADRAAALTHRLLAFSRRQPLDPRPVDANALVTSLEDLLRRTLGERIELEIVTARGLWTTLCDSNQLESALLNLAINARDAMPEGGRLTLETANTQLDRAYAAGHAGVLPGQYVCLSVADTGTGMAPEVAARAFEPFFTTKPIGQGTGLGLSMIYGFARQSEGHASISSGLGRGTTVKIFLPRYKGDLLAAKPTPPTQSRAPAGLPRPQTVLVVEDDPVVRELVVEVIRDLGLRTLEAEDGHGGLALLRSDAAIDLLITDLGLPGLDGRAMAKAARAPEPTSASGRSHAGRPGLKVLFITGYAEDAALSSGFLEPGMEMLVKPFAIDALVGRIETMLGKH